MVLVDTTVWIDFFGGKATPEVATLERLVDDVEICTCGIILTEVLQGFREDRDYQRTVAQFDAFLFLPMSRRTFVQAAEFYRSLRRRGITIRKTADCMIASVAVEYAVPLLHCDRDFDPLQRHCGLKVVTPDAGSRR